MLVAISRLVHPGPDMTHLTVRPGKLLAGIVFL
jgi:hypothetical protein